MKRIIPMLALCLLCCLTPSAAQYQLRGVWVSTVYNLDYPSAAGLSAAQLKAEADAIIENAAAWGLNAIFLQVRPGSDALYRSDIFPWSGWLSGTQGTAPDGGFDPLAYFIERAHGLEIEVHAWINPYRITRSAKETREQAFGLLAQGHPAFELEDAVVFHTDGCLYFDPGRPEARALIVEGAMEIVDRYAVDGIHMDDYFYPAGDFDDGSTYADFGQGFDSIGDFRRASVTQLIQTLSGKIRARSPYVSFGVSPFGIWANDSQHPEGSATRGDSSYFSHYADTKAWVQDGMVDYIMPQLYWQIGSQEADFDTLVDWWSQVVDGTGVDLYIGLAAYRTVDADADSVWYGADELARQFERMERSCVQGVCLYRYGSVDQALPVAQFAADYFAAPPERYVLPYRQPAKGLEGFSLDREAQVAAGGTLELSARAPLGSRAQVLFEGTAYPLLPDLQGTYQGALTPDSGTQITRTDLPMVMWERDGFVSLKALPTPVTVVETGEPAAVARIQSSSVGTGHRVVFYTEVPVAARVTQTGTAIELRLEPCRMAVLFEDDYFENIEVSTYQGGCLYTLMLPVDSQDVSCYLEWDAASVTLCIGPDGTPVAAEGEAG